MPRIVAVQAANCSPIYKAFSEGKKIVRPFDTKPTYAEGVALTDPVRGNQVLREIKKSNGIVTTVNEKEILSAWRGSAVAGFFTEPTSAVSLAGALKLMTGEGLIKSDEKVVIIMTGHGLKTKPEIITQASDADSL